MSFAMQRLLQLQSLPLEAKVGFSIDRIRRWVIEYGPDGVYVSFSGGKDSTVLLDLVRSIYPSIEAVFVDTGLEYPEIRDHVSKIENVVWVKPKMSFKNVIEKYGYPMVSKEVSQKVYEIKTTNSDKLLDIRMTGGEKCQGKLSEKWKFLVDAPFNISHKCCNELKKKPAKLYEKQTGRHPIVGTMASESMLRRTTYLRNGCNAFESSRPISSPMSIWNDDDVWEYIRSRGLKYASVYDTGVSRTGCVFCCFGVHMEKEPNRFQILRKSHPNLWSYCMNKLGLREVLNYIGVKTGDDEEKGQGTLF